MTMPGSKRIWRPDTNHLTSPSNSNFRLSVAVAFTQISEMTVVESVKSAVGLGESSGELFGQLNDVRVCIELTPV